MARYAVESGESVRNVYRDLETIRSAGYPVEHEGTRYWLPKGWTVMGARGVAPDELLALYFAREVVGAARGSLLGRGLDRLWTKLAADHDQARLLPQNDAPFRARSIGAIDYGPHRATLVELERAAATRTAVWCRFRRSRTGEISERVIEPGEVYLDPGLEALYCIAWCRLRQDVRVFAIHRFLEVRSTGERFAYRAESRSRAALHGAFRIWRGANIARVRLAFSRAVSPEIMERRWHPSQVLVPVISGGVVLEMSVAEPSELTRWLLGFGKDVEVLEPLDLRDAVRSAHEDALGPRADLRRAAPAGRMSRFDVGQREGEAVAVNRERSRRK